MSALEFGSMRRMDPAAVRFLIVHTQGSPGGADGTAAGIHQYHTDPCDQDDGSVNWMGRSYRSRAALPPEVRHRHGRGWSGIGYYKVFLKDGSVELGRPREYQGAHVEGLNHCSYGYCVTGNGDLSPFTDPQLVSLTRELAKDMQELEVPLGNVLGHREVNQLAGVPRTSKSCPGTHVSMRRIRSRILLELINEWPAPKIVSYPDRLTFPPATALELEFR